MGQRETPIQSDIMKALESLGCRVYRMNSGGRRGRVILHPKGTPDLLVFRGNKPYWIEVKSEDGEVSEIQKKVHSQLRSEGFHVLVTSNVEEAIEFVIK